MNPPVTAPPQPMLPVMRPWLGVEEQSAAAEAIASGWVAQGPRVAAFEQAVGARLAAENAVALSSCTAALHLALVLLGVGPGDEVVVPSLSFIATANAVRYVGAAPVFADVDAATLNLSVETIGAVTSPRTRAVILVHQAGTPADLDAVHGLCDPAGIAVVEDAACAIGASYRGVPIGAGGDLVALSFHPRKIITTGEGGMLLTASGELASRARRLREHGMSVSAAERHAGLGLVHEQYLETGFNYRMTDIQAAVGLVQLTRLDEIVQRRRDLAEGYRERLAHLPGLGLPADPPWGRSNFQSYVVTLPDGFPVSRDELLDRYVRVGISPRRGIMAAHLEPAYEGERHHPLPVTERLSRQSLVLPLFHHLTTQDQDRVADVLRAAAS